MVLLLRHLMSLVIESGFWFIESGVSIHPVELVVHPVELVVYQHPASVSILPVVLSASWFLPCWLLFILLVHSRYWLFTTVIGLLSWYPVGRSQSPDSW
jgi:hypothetical protein